MCEYCEGHETLAEDSCGASGIEVVIYGRELTANGWYGRCDDIQDMPSANTPINYCPMCGRDLRGDE